MRCDCLYRDRRVIGRPKTALPQRRTVYRLSPPEESMMPYKLEQTKGEGGAIVILCATPRAVVEAMEKFEENAVDGIRVT
jgi:hypothetical protein